MGGVAQTKGVVETEATPAATQRSWKLNNRLGSPAWEERLVFRKLVLGRKR